MNKIKIVFIILPLIILVVLVFYFSKSNFLVSRENLSSNLIKTYESHEYNFLFKYPDDFVVNSVSFGDGGNKIVLESSVPKNGLEITIFPFDEEGPLTEERIKQDLPYLPVVEIEIIDFIGTKALKFKSFEDEIGKTIEFWFIYNGNFYQIQTYEEFSERLEEILDSWQVK